MKKHNEGFIGTPTIAMIIAIVLLGIALWIQNNQLTESNKKNGELTETITQKDQALVLLAEENRTAKETIRLKADQMEILQKEKIKLAEDKLRAQKELELAKRKLPKPFTIEQVTPETPEEFQQSKLRIIAVWVAYCGMQADDPGCAQSPVEPKKE